jgi:hypothetical protein
MDGAKQITDTSDIRKDCGRQALCKGKSFSEREGEPCRDEDPGESRSIVL